MLENYLANILKKSLKIAIIANFIANALAALAAYCLLPKKPTINISFDTTNQLTLF